MALSVLSSGTSAIVLDHFLKNFMAHFSGKGLKVVSATFLLVSFIIVNESTYQTRKSIFYFTSKALSVLEEIKF